MTSAPRALAEAAALELAATTPGLQLLVLHGSRARDAAHERSDWDFAFQGDATVDADTLVASLSERLGAERVDLVNLDRAGALLRHRVARDGVVVFERQPDLFRRFWLAAVDTWCDLAPIPRAGVRRRPRRTSQVSPLDRAVLAERTQAVRRHLDRVASRLPVEPADLVASTDASDAVVLHLWQATQIVIDLAVSACVALCAGTPQTYADAFRRLQAAGVIDGSLADRLVRAAGFRNLVAHAYETLDMTRVHRAATSGPADLLAFIAAIDRQSTSR